MLIDDVDGSEANETIQFALDGVQYEIDLNETHAKELRDSLATWVDSARRVAGRRRPGRAAASSSNGSSGNTNEVRQWAKANGYEVSDRGRISAAVREAYEAAH